MDEMPDYERNIADFFKLERQGGHGHVFPRDDGLLARCGGPALCNRCRLAQDVLESVQRYNDTMPTLRIVL